MVFRDSEAVIWQATPGLPRVSLPAPYGKNERYVGIVRGPVASREAAEKILTESVRKRLNIARAQGPHVPRMVLPAAVPGEKPSLEAIGVDVWFDADGMKEIYNEPAEMEGLKACSPPSR